MPSSLPGMIIEGGGKSKFAVFPLVFHKGIYQNYGAAGAIDYNTGKDTREE